MELTLLQGKAPIRCKLTNDNDEEVCKVIVADNKDGTYSCKYEHHRFPGNFIFCLLSFTLNLLCFFLRFFFLLCGSARA